MRQAFTLACITLAIWVPRALALDRFVTADEPLWLTRSANYACALGRRDFDGTFQREHPGVTTMWAGAAGVLWQSPEYGRNCSYLTDKDEFESVLRERGLEPIRLLAASRCAIVLANTFVLVLAYAFARHTLGRAPAFVGLLLIAFDPFHIAHSRLLHVDALLSNLMLLAVLAFVSYLRRRRLSDLILSSVAAGASWLTKSPGLFLVPFVGLLALVDLWTSLSRRRISLKVGPRSAALTPLGAQAAHVGVGRGLVGSDDFYSLSLRLRKGFHSAHVASRIWRFVWPLIAWSVVGIATFTILWPAMWTAPIGVLSRMFNLADLYASGGHGKPIFFNGVLVSDGRLGTPFWYFYPITFLWRSTPIVLVGLLTAAAAFVLKREPLALPETRHTVVALALFAAAFAIAVSLSAKKFDRYLLPVYASLDLVAAVGWIAIARWLGERQFALLRQHRVSLVLGVAIVAQMMTTLPTFPYYLSYYNPLMGGSSRAPRVMMIGWGEGIEQAARYLNEKPEADQLRVFSWHHSGSFSYFFKGTTGRIPNEDKWQEIDLQVILNADYAVIYHVQQQQRQAPSQLLNCLAHQTPEHSIWINGLEYVRIYRLSHDLSADSAYVRVGALLGEDILLQGYRLPANEFVPGDIIPIWLSWRAVEAPGERLKVFLHVLNGAGALVAQDDAEPAAWSRPTDGWQAGEQITDGHGLLLPPGLPSGEYSLVVGMYRSSGERLSITQAGEPVGDAFTLGQITIKG